MANRFRTVEGIACHSPPGDNGEYLRGFYCPSTYQLLCELKKNHSTTFRMRSKCQISQYILSNAYGLTASTDGLDMNVITSNVVLYKRLYCYLGVNLTMKLNYIIVLFNYPFLVPTV